MRRAIVAVACAAVLVGPAFAAEPPPGETLAKFRTERAEALKSFAPGEVAAADELAVRSEAALKAENPSAAARLARDARWQLPFLPPGLPVHVSRVLGVARLRHADRVNSLVYSPDGTVLASASRDGTVKLWDLGNGREVLTYRGHSDGAAPKSEDQNVMRVPAVAFAPDGLSVASAGEKEIHVWDAKTGKKLKTLAGHIAPIRGLAFADANTLVSGADDRRVIVWDVAGAKPSISFPDQPQRVEGIAIGGKGKLVATVNAAGELYVYSLAGDRKPLLSVPVTDGGQAGYAVGFVADGPGIITAGGDKTAKLTTGPTADGTSPGSGAAVRSYVGHTEKINALAVSPDGKLLVTGGKDTSVRVWEVATGKPVRAYQGHGNWVTAIAIRPDGKQAASGAEDGTIRLWPLATVDDHRASTEATDSLWSVALSPDGKQFAAAGADKTIRIYDAGTGKLYKDLKGHKGAIPVVLFTSPTTLASGSGDKTVKLWNIATGQAQDLAGHTSAVLALAADEPGKLLVSGSVDKSVRGWDAGSGKPLWTWTGKSAVCAVAVTKNGSRVAVGTADGWLTILAPAGTGEPKVLGGVSAHGAGVAAVSFHPDGTKVATCGGDGVVRIWTLPETGNPTQIGKLEPPARGGAAPNTTSPLSSVMYSNDGKYLAAGGADSATRVWDAASGAEVRSFRAHTDWVTAVAFAPSGQAIYSASVDKAVRMFDLAQQEASAAAGHTQPLLSVAVSPNGKYAATGAQDKLVKVWDLATGREVATLTGATDYVNAVGFVDANTVVASGDDGRIRWWSIDPVKLIAETPTGGKAFNMATAGGKVAVVWTRDKEKFAGFEVYTLQNGTATMATQVHEKGRQLSCAVLAADGTLAVSGGKEDGVVRVWDLDKKERIGSDWPLFAKSVADLALTPDKKTLVAIDADGTVKVADVATREAGPAIKAVTNGVVGVVVAPTADRFATLSAEGDVKAWDMKGTELRSWKLPVAPAAAAFTPDGKKLVVANRDGTAYVLDLP